MSDSIGETSLDENDCIFQSRLALKESPTNPADFYTSDKTFALSTDLESNDGKKGDESDDDDYFISNPVIEEPPIARASPLTTLEEDDYLRYVVKHIMTNPIVDNFFLILIIINSIMMGIGTFDFISEDKNSNAIFFFCDLGFLVIFTIESGLSIFHLRRDALTDKWVLCDFLIIILSWASSAAGRFDHTAEGINVQIVRSLRTFRILNKVESLKTALVAIGRSFARLASLSIFCTIITFIFAIYFTEQFGDMYENGQTNVDYFSRLDWTFLTLYQFMTFDSWMFVTRQITDVYPLAWIPIILFIILTAIVVLNLAIAIICDSIFELHSDSKADKVKMMTKDMKDLEYLMHLMCYEICDHLTLPLPPSADSSGMVNSHHSISDIGSVGDSQIRSYDCTCGSYSEFRTSCGKIINNDYVQGVMVVLIIFNAAILAISTFSFVKDDPSTFAKFEIINTILLVIYTIEIGMQLITHGLAMFKDGWHTFDFILIILSWVLSLSPAFRVFRVLRLVHILPKFEAMRVITSTLYAAIPRIGAVVGILLLLFYITAVIFTMLFKDIPVGGEGGLSYGYFSRLDKSLLTLFQIMTMERWAKISRELGAHISWAPLPISAFLTISGLLFMNAIVALICQANEGIVESKKEVKAMLKNGPEKNFEERVLAIKAMHADILKLLEIDSSNPNNSN